jgi:hypothetical protein
MASHLLSTFLAPFRPGFTRPTWRKVLTLLEGTLLARGPRTVTAALRATGLHQYAQFNVFHPVLSRARWSPLQMSRVLFLLLVRIFVPAGAPVPLVIDETLERRWGPHIRKCSVYHDPVRSTQGYPKMSRGLKWLCLMLVVRPPWTQHSWALPFFCVLLSSAELDAKERRRHKTVPEWTGQLIKAVRRWLPDVPITLVGDGAYSSTELGLTCATCQVTLIAPLRADACLYAPLPPRPPRQEGRPRVVGERLPRLDHILADPSTPWQTAAVTWYGQGKRQVEWCSGTGWWYRYRARHLPLPLRWVISRDPTGARETRIYFSTDPTLSGLDILLAFMNRWSAEVTFEEGRAHLGIQAQRQWSDPAIERSTPCLFALYSLVTLFGRLLYPKGDLPVLQTAWYHKQQATFSDVLATVRFSLWNPFRYPTLPENPDVILLPRSEVSRLLAGACGSP